MSTSLPVLLISTSSKVGLGVPSMIMSKLSQPYGLDEAPPRLSARLYDYFRPIVELGLSVYYFLLTFLAFPILPFSDLQTFHHKAFASFWSAYGAIMSAGMPDGTAELIASCSGLVLDVGPGSGTQVHLFDPEKITMLYGVEPAVDLHAALHRATEKVGLQGKYEIITAGAEAGSLIPELAKRNLFQDGEESIFDTVVCIRVLCGVPDHLATIDGLYRLLKPGGRFLVCEHVLQPYPKGGDFVASLLQKLYTALGWSFWVGGCCLDRDTDAALRQVAGPDGWDEIKATYLSTYSTVPYLVGEYIKST